MRQTDGEQRGPALLSAAVRDNIRWCSDVCATGAVVEPAGTWVTTGPPPPLFPDLVTARPGVSGGAVAARLAGRTSCSVKDSFADLELESHGFAVLFTAQWIGRPAPTATEGTSPAPWSLVSSRSDLVRWSAAAGLPAPLPAHVLATPGTAILVRYDHDSPVAGFVATSDEQIVGISNVFGPPDHSVWADVVAGVDTLFPGRSMVGYEGGADLEAAQAASFECLGPLRIWSRHE